MENAVDALKMAAAILVFVIAIASSFSLFDKARETADSIVTMRDKQAYLTSAELDNGILYTSTEAITEGEEDVVAEKIGVTTNGDRIVSIEDIVSTITRYSTEKYGVNIINEGKLIARFDSWTESQIKAATADQLTLSYQFFQKHSEDVLDRIKTKYCPNPTIGNEDNILELYQLEESSSNFKYGAPWYVSLKEIPKRIGADLNGTEYTDDVTGQKYKGKGLLNIFKAALNANKYIVEVIIEKDNSTYLKDKDEDGNEIETNLLQEYEMPTIEVVYIIM